eukprot:1723825-Amphidinium_carterae.1
MQAVANKDAASVWSAIPAPLKLQIPRALWGIVLLFDFASCNPLVSLIAKLAILIKVVAVFGTIGIMIYKGMQLWQKYGKDVGHVYGLVAGQVQGPGRV